ncbi:MAG TPA: hypothetical protein VLU94_01335, partial [Candidatus Nitrosotalea sp.]|nr:hypothetical protein [Candidatus Nitrosotalea sp.]
MLPVPSLSAICATCLILGFAGSATLAADKGAANLKPSTGKKQSSKDDKDKKPETPKDEEKAFDEVVKDMEVTKGLFTFYRKADDGRVLIEILPEQL